MGSVQQGVQKAIEQSQLPADFIPVRVTFDGSSYPSSMPLGVDTYLAGATSINASGDNAIVSPGASNAVRLHYICLSADGANAADVMATVKIGSATKYILSLKAGAIWAHFIGAGRRYLQGSNNENLIVSLSGAQTVKVSVEYEII